jgi:anthranilate synthase/aminodeoxychorismate synthase-like glutamine amidotransferase
MAAVLVIDHHDSYTYNLVHLVGAVTGRLPDVVQHDEPGASRWRAGYSHLVLSPGPGSVTCPGDFAIGREIIATAAVPVLGVCLGMQGMASVLGGGVRVRRPAHGEVAALGHDGSGLFTGLPQGFDVVRYHSQAVVDVPAELSVTAWCDDQEGRVVMGLAHVSRPLFGVQFHPESVLSQHGRAMVANVLQMSA